jgi:hypothetical protein
MNVFNLLLFAIAAHAQTPGIDLNDLPPARTPEEAYASFDARLEKVVDYFAAQQQPPFNKDNGVGFWLVALGKLHKGFDVESVNRALLDPKATVYAKIGSDFQLLGWPCRRTGDYDFMLRGLVQMFYLFGDQPDKIWPETRAKLLYYFLNQRGNRVHTWNFFWLCGSWPETENHILQGESSRYLTNQLLAREAKRLGKTVPRKFDNARNGMTKWMLRHLQEFFKTDFSEYNSHSYQAYTVMAIENLANFTEEPRVKLAAEMLLNYLDAKFAVSSNGLRRLVPFRRQPPYRGRTDMLNFDDEMQRFIQMAGSYGILRELPRPYFLQTAEDRMMMAGLGTYRTPALILDLVMNPEHKRYFQRFHHLGLEIYDSTPSYLLSAGGIWVNRWDFFTHENSGWPVWTTVMPTAGGIDAKDYIRIEGSNDFLARVNTCVAPGFACGLNPVVPPSVPQECIEKRDDGRGGTWTFVDYTSNACPWRFGFFAAVHTNRCQHDPCQEGGGKYGFLEVAEPTSDLDYASFRDRVLSFNSGRDFPDDEENSYFMSNGREVRFDPRAHKPWTYPIRSIGRMEQEVAARGWPMASGTIIRADGSGLITIVNPWMRRRLVLDMRHAMAPNRIEESF